MSPLKALGGTSDILPEESERWQRIEEDARRIFKLYGYREIRTPLIEETAVFTRSLGEAAEIVTKQMYLLQDRGGRGGRSAALRPEGTASAVRAFNEEGLDKRGGLIRWYYLGPMFRAERPQAGRRRQFHQIGVEIFGSASPFQDVEVLLLLTDLLSAWRIEGYALKINSMGCRADRKKMVEQVVQSMKPHRERLCEDCRVRLTKNPLRILDCKKKPCQQLAGDIDLSQAVCPECRSHLDAVTKTLKGLKVSFEEDRHLVRGLDYYTRTCFEVIHPGLGAQNALGGGGRYDDLVEQMGGVKVPAVGFAVGLERILMAQAKVSQAGDLCAVSPQVFVATVAASDIPEAIRLAQQLRERGICATANLEDRPLKRQMEQASKWGCRFVLIRAQGERAKGVVTLKEMASGTQREIPEGEWLKAIEEQLNPC